MTCNHIWTDTTGNFTILALQWVLLLKILSCPSLLSFLGGDGGTPSRCPWLDSIRIAFAKIATASAMHEAFTPATHDTGWSHNIACLQGRCHELAAAGVLTSKLYTYPFADVLGECALLYRQGRLVVDLNPGFCGAARSPASPPPTPH